jgi:hypothetical protein
MTLSGAHYAGIWKGWRQMSVAIDRVYDIKRAIYVPVARCTYNMHPWQMDYGQVERHGCLSWWKQRRWGRLVCRYFRPIGQGKRKG